jgi:hypothetical protein
LAAKIGPTRDEACGHINKLSGLNVKVELADIGLRRRVWRSELAFSDDELTPGEIEKISV